MLCGIGLRFNLFGGDVFGRVSDKGSSEGIGSSRALLQWRKPSCRFLIMPCR